MIKSTQAYTMGMTNTAESGAYMIMQDENTHDALNE
jgi:hypothetical protein